MVLPYNIIGNMSDFDSEVTDSNPFSVIINIYTYEKGITNFNKSSP